MIIDEQKIVKVDVARAEYLFEFMEKCLSAKLIKCVKDIEDQTTTVGGAVFDVGSYMADIFELVKKKILDDENETKKAFETLFTDTDMECEPITTPVPKGKKKIETEVLKMGTEVNIIKEREKPVGVEDRAWDLLPIRVYNDFKRHSFGFTGAPTNNFWWEVVTTVQNRKGQLLYVLKTCEDESSQMWCLVTPEEIEAIKG